MRWFLTRLLCALALCPATLAFVNGQAGGGNRARFVAESTAIARTLFDIEIERAAALDTAGQRARQVLAASIIFAAGSTSLSDLARVLLNQKAWLLYTNPALSVRLTGIGDSALAGDVALPQARARVDTVRRYLVARGVDADRVGVDEPESPSAAAGYSRVVFRSDGDITVLDVPPATAAPPPLEPIRRLDGTMGTARFKWGVVRLFYATDRRRGDTGRAQTYYAGDQSPNGALEFGRIEVSIPRVHRRGRIEQPAWYTIDRSTTPDRHFEVRSIVTLGDRATFDSLRRLLNVAGRREALVFIHGFNVSFYDAALRAAQLTYDLAFEGAPILYSWPSAGSVFRYSSDREAAEWSADHLRLFLDSLTAIAGVRRVHIVAHSMGNRVLTLALERMSAPRPDTVFGNLVLAAADVDATRFQQQIAALIRPLALRLTIYQSGKDVALWASRFLSTHTRLGEATNPMLVIRDADMVDVSSLSTGLLGHGYIASNESLIDDLFVLFRDRRAPPRDNMDRVDTPGGAYWRLR
jgi:esterase/lipase superfamily enzyme